MKLMEEGFKEMNKKIDGMDTRLENVEGYVKNNLNLRSW